MDFGLLLQSYGFDLKYVVAAMVGAAGMYVFSSRRGFDNSRNFLQRMKPGKSDTFYNRSDFAVVTVLGGLIGYLFFAPQDVPRALIAGLGWTAALNVGTSQPKTRPPRQPPKTRRKR
jgi:hypothetical protein